MHHEAKPPPDCTSEGYDAKQFGDWLRSNDGADTYASERTRLTSAQADKAELELLELRGLMIRVALIEQHWQGMVASMRARLLSIPSECAGQIAAPEKAQAAQDVLRSHIYEALNEIAGDSIPRPFRDRIAAQAQDADESGSEAAAEADDLAMGAGKPDSVRRGQRKPR
jgi:phage terminase Nu1 subunit (DNA packaging protein)